MLEQKPTKWYGSRYNEQVVKINLTSLYMRVIQEIKKEILGKKQIYTFLKNFPLK